MDYTDFTVHYFMFSCHPNKPEAYKPEDGFRDELLRILSEKIRVIRA